jgi:hypothetical protein
MGVLGVSRYRPVMCSKRCCGFSTQVFNAHAAAKLSEHRWRPIYKALPA